MPILADSGSVVGVQPDEPGEEDRYIRIKDVLELRHQHPPKGGVTRRSEPDSLDDCLILKQKNIQRFCFRGPLSWACYEEIAEGFRDGRSGRLRPYSRAAVFAPVKVVLAESDRPIRAVLTYGPVYPWQNKLATLREGQRLWLAYAAVAVLNSNFGGQFYRKYLLQNPTCSKKRHGLSKAAVVRVPVAKRDYTFEELGKVVDLTYQRQALAEACEACVSQLQGKLGRVDGKQCEMGAHYTKAFAKHMEGVEARLQDEIRRLLGLDETEEYRLLRDERSPAHGSSAQRSFFQPWEMMPAPPPPPPIKLIPAAERDAFPVEACAGRRVPDAEDIKLLQYWEGVINSRPPRDLRAETVAA